jgi:Zn-dependent M28 family amino/carboxypeptidase
MEPENETGVPENTKQIITLCGLYFSADCCIWETAFDARARYISVVDLNVALAL